MLINKLELEKYLVFKDDKDEFIIFENPLTKEQRTLAQNNTFYMCFDRIGKKLGYSLEETKQAVMKGVFGTKMLKLGGMQYEIAIKGSTTELNKEQAILLIERLIEFGKKLGLGTIVQSRELQNLFYNN